MSKRSFSLVLCSVFSIAAATGALAQDRPPDGRHQEHQAQATQDENHGVGVVQSVDTAAGRVTIAHEPIKELNWPAMTMGFKVSDPTLLQSVKAGNKVEFMLRGKDMTSAVVTSIKVVQ